MTGSSPFPPGFGAQPPGTGPSPPPGGPGYTPQPSATFSPNGASARSRTGLLTAGVVLGVLLSVAALALSIITAVRSPETPQSPTKPQENTQELFVDDADKALCESIGPLMREEANRANALLDSGEPDSPARKAAIPKFKSDTLDWGNRIQTQLNEHADPPRFLTRTLQQYIDGMLLYSENLHADRSPDPFDNTTYESAIVALGGPLATCYKVGAGW
jgi:hypothetical protein